MFDKLTQAEHNEVLLLLQQIGNPAQSKAPGYLDRKTCGAMARKILELLGQPLVGTEASAGPVSAAESFERMTLVKGDYVIYTDGACKGNPGPAGWGVVVLDSSKNMLIQEGDFIGTATNQVAELTAAIAGLRFVPEGSSVLLISDSQYTLKGLTEWRRGWESRGMRNGAGEIVANLEIWKELYALADARKVTTQWVKGHSGNAFNEICDQLANKAIREQGTVSVKPQFSDI